MPEYNKTTRMAQGMEMRFAIIKTYIDTAFVMIVFINGKMNPSLMIF